MSVTYDHNRSLIEAWLFGYFISMQPSLGPNNGAEAVEIYAGEKFSAGMIPRLVYVGPIIE